MINVTKSYLPPLENYTELLEEIWEAQWVTNNGQFVQELEEKLKKYLEVKHIVLVSNGTIALQIAIKALELQGEIITTPFSYVATTSSIAWENCTPKFVDIDPETFCINVDLLKSAITDQTKAIIPTHIFGNICDVDSIMEIANQHNINIIYDASHSFGVKYKDISILNYGDVSTLSFHATKLFHTIEGGALVTNDGELANKFRYMRNFGHDPDGGFFGLGINGKLSELHAAMGVCILPKVEDFISARQKISGWYSEHFKDTNLKMQRFHPNIEYNYSYYPVIFDSEEQLLNVKEALIKHQIYARRYFYPSLNLLNFVENTECPNSESISKRILCLPLYFELTEDQINHISELIINALNENA